MTTRFLTFAALLAACGNHADLPIDAPHVLADAPQASDASVVDLAPDLATIAAANALPALAAIAADEHHVLARGVTGVRKLGAPTLATTADTWHLGSDTKAMTATLIARYVERGTLAWDETVAAAFPGVSIDPGYQQVTLRMLLAHVGGAPADLPFAVAVAMHGPGSSQALRRAAVLAILAQPPGATVGSFTYSNAGYMIAGAALEQATGAAWEDLIRDQLFAPLGMTTCGFGPTATGDLVDEPWGHIAINGVLTPMNVDNPPALGPAGTVHCALGDWLAFLREHLNGANGAPTVLGLAPATWTTLHTPWPGSSGSYALGWIVVSRPWANGLALAHVGSNTLNVADVWIAPAIHRVFIATTNCGGDPATTGTDAVITDLVTRFPSR
jgi:D-alanyl-D-alanine carboxypeptidase